MFSFCLRFLCIATWLYFATTGFSDDPAALVAEPGEAVKIPIPMDATSNPQLLYGPPNARIVDGHLEWSPTWRDVGMNLYSIKGSSQGKTSIQTSAIEVRLPTVDVGFGISKMQVSQDGQFLLAWGRNGSEIPIAVVDTKNMKVISRADVTGLAGGLVDEKYVYIFDLQKNAIVRLTHQLQDAMPCALDGETTPNFRDELIWYSPTKLGIVATKATVDVKTMSKGSPMSDHPTDNIFLRLANSGTSRFFGGPPPIPSLNFEFALAGKLSAPPYDVGLMLADGRIVGRIENALIVSDQQGNPLAIFPVDGAEFRMRKDVAFCFQSDGQKITKVVIPSVAESDSGTLSIVPPSEIPFPLEKNTQVTLGVEYAKGAVKFESLIKSPGITVEPKTGKITIDLGKQWKAYLANLSKPNSRELVELKSIRNKSATFDSIFPKELLKGKEPFALWIAVEATDEKGHKSQFQRWVVVLAPSAPIDALLK